MVGLGNNGLGCLFLFAVCRSVATCFVLYYVYITICIVFVGKHPCAGSVLLVQPFPCDKSDNNTNPIISSCLEISTTCNPFSSRFPFPVAIHRRNVCRVNGLHNILPLLPPGDHACMQNNWHLLE